MTTTAQTTPCNEYKALVTASAAVAIHVHVYNVPAKGSLRVFTSPFNTAGRIYDTVDWFKHGQV